MARPPTGKRKTTKDGAVGVAGKLPNGSGSVYFVQTTGCWRATYVDESTGKRLPCRHRADRKPSNAKLLRWPDREGRPLTAT